VDQFPTRVTIDDTHPTQVYQLFLIDVSASDTLEFAVGVGSNGSNINDTMMVDVDLLFRAAM
jgi:hypothetical protein